MDIHGISDLLGRKDEGSGVRYAGEGHRASIGAYRGGSGATKLQCFLCEIVVRGHFSEETR